MISLMNIIYIVRLLSIVTCYLCVIVCMLVLLCAQTHTFAWMYMTLVRIQVPRLRALVYKVSEYDSGHRSHFLLVKFA